MTVGSVTFGDDVILGHVYVSITPFAEPFGAGISGSTVAYSTVLAEKVSVKEKKNGSVGSFDVLGCNRKLNLQSYFIGTDFWV